MVLIRIPLETVTPLFLAGANSRGEPELRPPAFRGALRYWMRAALGGVYGDTQAGLKMVRKEEAAIFGAAADDDSGSASSVTIRLAYGNLPEPILYQKQPAINSNRGEKPVHQPTGRDYLYWSMPSTGSIQNNNLLPAKQYYPSATNFDLVVSIRSGVAESVHKSSQVQIATWLLVNLGGIGSRSRRTAGSLSVRQPIELEELKFQAPSSQVENAATFLSHNLNKVLAMAGDKNYKFGSRISGFDILSPDTCRVWVIGQWNTADQAIDYIGTKMCEFRTYSEPDHTGVARWLRGSTIPTVERSPFGLPIPYRYSNGGPSGTIQGKVLKTPLDRRASPLWLKISKAGDGHYFGVATLFLADFLPDQGQLIAKTRAGNPPPIYPPEDYKIIESWITNKFSRCSEVHYG